MTLQSLLHSYTGKFLPYIFDVMLLLKINQKCQGAGLLGTVMISNWVCAVSIH